MSFFDRLKLGMGKTRNGMVKNLDEVIYNTSVLDEDFYEELEELLIMGDVGISATSKLMDRIREQVAQQHIKDTRSCRELLVEDIREMMKTNAGEYAYENQKTVIFVIGVNGVGKTTSVGKLSHIFKRDGKKVLVAAADTYRAAATEQLQEWTNRAGVPLITGREGGDPASVIYDAVNAAKARDTDILIVDTAGRLHNKKNLMEELKKMNRILDKELPGFHRENFVVLDAATGQNAMQQAREFGETADLTGIILTKMDGTAKGGIAIAIVSELNVPVKYIGVGEKIDDLERFDPDEFVDALFGIDRAKEEEEGRATAAAINGTEEKRDALAEAVAGLDEDNDSGRFRWGD